VKKIVIVLSIILISSLSYSFDGKITFDNNGNLKDMIEAISNSQTGIEVPTVTEKRDALKEWTVMVFVNAKNNLESYGLKDVNEMEMVGSTDKVNIIAELGRISGYSSEDGDWTGCRRLYVTKDNDTQKINSKVLLQNSKCDMGSWEYLVDFVKWTKEKYPAKKYLLIVWNHGSGWNKNLEMLESAKGISYDDETGNHITTPQLRQVLEKTGKIEIFAMDACLMQMIEVAYEIKDYADYIVASEETEPADGYTYNTWLGPLVNKPTMEGYELSKAMVNSYTDHYQSINQGATQSAIKSSSLINFTKLINDFIDTLIASNDLTVAKNARSKAQSFYYSSNKDIYHFVKLIVDTTQVPEVKAKGQALLDFMKAELIVHNRAYGSKYANAFGLAGYLPSYYSTSYDVLNWAKDSKWDDLINWMK